MKGFEICEEGTGISLGVLLYYEKSRTFIAELKDDLDEWSAPLLFSGLVKKGVYTIPRDVSMMWVRERIIPTGRQNINAILTTHRLKEYSEIRFLELAEGRCAQDDLYIKSIDKLPDYVKERLKKNLIDCMPYGESGLLCLFADETVKTVSLLDLTEPDGIDKVLRNKDLYRSCCIGPGGYCATFNDSIDIPSQLLYDCGKTLPLKCRDLMDFVLRNILDTQESTALLGCSRQNLSYLVKKDQLVPVKENAKGNLYLKGDVLKNSW